MYVCSRNTAKPVQDGAKNFSPPYSPFSCGVQCQVSFKSGNEKKLLKNQFPISVKYSLGEFDQCKQPQRYSSLELSFCFVFLEIIYFKISNVISIDKERFIFKHKINIAILISYFRVHLIYYFGVCGFVSRYLRLCSALE